MRRLWLIFAQAVTFSVAVLFVVQTLKPEWLASRPSIVPLQEAAPVSAMEEAHRSAHSYSEAARKALPAVVHIFTSKAVRQRSPFADDPLLRHFFGERFGSQTQRVSNLGSGVIVSPNGFVLTNHHVVEGAEDIEVSMNDGRNFRARIVGTDPESDVAVLQIEAGARLPAVTFARPESLQVGDVVLAIGNPFGVGQTVTMGIVSALGRSHLGINTFENFIQTDAAINPGNSGGALVDANGNLVGINTAIFSRSGGSLGIGFAIPVSLARSVMEQIIQTGSVTRGWVGVEVQQITPDLIDSLHLANADGTLITGIVRGSPADRAGIKPGDVLLAIGGKPVRDPQVMLDTVAALKPGASASFRLRRDKTEIDTVVAIGKRPPPARNGE
ncbi:MAG: Do family serine endopeptidase [Xanthomonadales bacterium]|nr:Do family serine endopeptidase [Xanthomonadales bacterium]